MTKINNSETENLTLFQRNYLLQAWLCISLALLFGVALAGVQTVLGPKIESNKINEAKKKVPELILGRQEAEKMATEGRQLTITPDSISLEVDGRPKTYTVYDARYPDGRYAGCVVKTKGMGYGDRIELLVGFNPSAESLTGLYILDQKETPGLGNKITEENWRDQFNQKSTNQLLAVVKSKPNADNQINAVTGATISSRSVVNIINNAVTELKDTLAKRQSEQKTSNRNKEN